MAHGHDAIHSSKIPRGIKNGVEQRDQRGDAFERESLRPKIASLKNLFEQVRADQTLQYFPPIDLQLLAFKALRNPSPPLWFREVHEFRANVAAVDAPRFLRRLARQPLQIRMLHRLEHTQRIQRGFVIPPASKSVKNAFALLAVPC